MLTKSSLSKNLKIFIKLFLFLLISNIYSDQNIKFLESTKEIITGLKEASNRKLPIAVFHGLDDDCQGRMLYWTNYFGEKASVYSRCIESGPNKESARNNIFNQGNKACELINSDPNFQNDFVAIGYSQGGLVARYVLEKCQMKGTVKKLITFGTPHMGVSKIPECPDKRKDLCKIAEKLGAFLVYLPGVYNIYAPLAYFRRPSTENLYRRFNTFIADLNNETLKKKNKENNKSKFLNLETIVLVNYINDSMVYPSESALFRKYDKDFNVEPLEDSKFYKEDYLGLRKLNEEKKVKFYTWEGYHTQMTHENVDKYIIPELI